MTTKPIALLDTSSYQTYSHFGKFITSRKVYYVTQSAPIVISIIIDAPAVSKFYT